MAVDSRSQHQKPRYTGTKWLSGSNLPLALRT